MPVIFTRTSWPVRSVPASSTITRWKLPSVPRLPNSSTAVSIVPMRARASACEVLSATWRSSLERAAMTSGATWPGAVAAGVPGRAL